jgi:hypothetical protein
MLVHYTTKIRDARSTKHYKSSEKVCSNLNWDKLYCFRLVGFPPPLEESGDIFFK